jgi:hypothetical protein
MSSKEPLADSTKKKKTVLIQIPWVRMRELNQGQQQWWELRCCDFVLDP